MRPDAIGILWQDIPLAKKAAKEKVVRVAPEPVWLREDYLPGLEEAERFPIEIMTDLDIMVSQQTNDRFIFDTECYVNYWCIVFRSITTGKALVFEKNEWNVGLDTTGRLRWILDNITLVSFNGINYDAPMLALSLDGVECDALKQASDDLIVNGFRGYQVLARHNVAPLALDHIDLIEVAPIRRSLKAYGSSMHVPRMQDLPFHPNVVLTPNQIKIVRWYCVNDTTSTCFLHEVLKNAIDLRYTLSNENHEDLRSKSDAQIAEGIIGIEYKAKTGRRAQRPTVPPGTVYHYERPPQLAFQTPIMNRVLQRVLETPFVVGDDGKVKVPKEIESLKFNLGASTYQMGNGGLHSTEKSTYHVTDENYQLIDADVESYYPMLILLQRYFPPHLGEAFLDIFAAIVKRRLDAKHRKDKKTSDSLKIVINGTFGKLGSVWSIMYAPKLMFHVTVGGQLFLLMLIEALELVGIPVVSGNTDGIMIKCPRDKIELCNQVLKWWESVTGFKTEGKEYKGIYSRDINNYFAIDYEGNVKHKGAYNNPWNEKGANAEFVLKKNPVTLICTDAVGALLSKGIPIEKTIRESRDFTKFVACRHVGGGAVKDGEYLGKEIRWYYSTEERGKEIVKAKNGHLVATTLGAKPAMQMPDKWPDDIDYEWYIDKASKILIDVGFAPKSKSDE